MTVRGETPFIRARSASDGTDNPSLALRVRILDRNSMNHNAYLALGANLGDRVRMMSTVVVQIERISETRILALSSLYETTPVGGPPGQPDYLNAVVRIETRRSPHDLLADCLAIERDLGRQRTVPDGPRTIDIDILLYDEVVLDGPGLIIPHPRMHARRFVLQPLAEIAPGLHHPSFGATIRELLDRLPPSDRGTVRLVGPETWGHR